MSKIEKSVLDWIDEHLIILIGVLVSVAGLLVRLPLLDHISGDSRFFLLPWYEQILENGLSVQVGNYNLVYQAAIWLMTKLPLEPLYAYKALSTVFDYALAVSTGALTGKLAGEKKEWKALASYSAVLLLPTVFLNSCAWAQCDSIFCTFGILALLQLVKEKYPSAMVLLGLSFACKLQAVFFLPVFLFVYYRQRRFSVLQFALIPAAALLTGLPMILFGRNILDTFRIYFQQTETYPYMSMNYPTPWLLLTHEQVRAEYTLLGKAAMVVTVAVLAVLMLLWLHRGVQAKGEHILMMGFLLAYTCVLFLPSMHERYGYPYEIMAVALAVLMPKTLPLCAGLVGISLCTYGSYLFGNEVFSLQVLAVANLAVYSGYVWYLNRIMRSHE